MTQQFETVNQPQYGNRPDQPQQQVAPAFQPAPQGQPQQQVPVQYGQQQQYQPQQAPQYPQQPQQQPQQQQRQPRGRGQGGQQRQIIRKPTQSGQPLEGLNYACFRGYLAEPQFGYTKGGRPYIRFNVLVPSPIIDNGQPVVDANGNVQMRETVWRCEGWMDIAEQLGQVQEGTPIFVEGSNHKYSFKSQQTGQDVWVQDVKVQRWQYI